jgi:hypothetical protein
MTLETQLIPEMFEDAFSFGMDYFRNPAKVLKDRTGEKTRGLGEILTANLMGKLIELGVCKILEDNTTDKKFHVNMEVRSDFVYNQPDISRIVQKGRISDKPNYFVEIKNSPENFEWVSLYETQFDEMKNYVKEDLSISSDVEDKIYIIYARIVDKFGNTISSETDEDGEGDNDNENDNENDDENEDNEEQTDDGLEEFEKIEIQKLEDDLKQKLVVLEGLPSRNIPSKSEEPDESKRVEITNTRKEKKSELRKEIKKLKTLIKNLSSVFPKRKKDLLGVFLKHKKFLNGKFDYFFDISDLSVRIDYIISGKEIDNYGKIFPKGMIWPSPKVFLLTKEISCDENGVLNDTPTTKYKRINTTNNGTYTLQTDVITNSSKFPEQFGSLTCTGSFEIILQERKNRKGKWLKTIFIKCLSNVVVNGDFLGDWNFSNGTTYRIKITNKLGGDKTKDRSDISMPKDRIESVVSETVDARISRIAQEI